jgi:amino acid permease
LLYRSIVGIPYAMKMAGFGGGFILILVSGYLTEYSLRLLVATAKHVHVSTYETLAEAAFGKIYGFRFLAINMFVTAYGAMISYLMIIKDCFSHLLQIDSHDVARQRALLILVSLFTVVPLASQRDMANLATTSRLSVVIDIVLVAAVASNAPILTSLYHRYYPNNNNNYISDDSTLDSTYIMDDNDLLFATNFSNSSSLYNNDTNADTTMPLLHMPSKLQLFVQFMIQDAWKVHWNTMFVGLGVLSFAFVCQHSAFIIAGSLHQPTIARWSVVTQFSLIFCIILAFICGATGYLGYFDSTTGNILNSLPLDSWTANVARTLLGVSMLFVYPMGKEGGTT